MVEHRSKLLSIKIPNSAHKPQESKPMLPSRRQNIAAEVQLFNILEQKENFLIILGALTARIISLKKASEVLTLEPDTFLKILELMGIEFSYLTEDDIAAEKVWQ